MTPYERIKALIQQNIIRIQETNIEDNRYTDRISRAFLWILKNDNIQYSQAQFNRANKSIQELWEIAYFECRYILNFQHGLYW